MLRVTGLNTQLETRNSQLATRYFQMKHLFITILAIAVMLDALPSDAARRDRSRYRSVHMASTMVEGGCRSCHFGSRMNRSVTEACMQCHGGIQKIETAEKKKILSPFYRASKSIAEIDLSREFDKIYKHPVGEAPGVHNPYEELPEDDPNTPRHVECTDCHHHHFARSNRMYVGLRGISKKGIYGVRATKEYEVCFNCHSDSYNLPVNQENKRLEFDEDNPSYHPVVAEGKSSIVPSLIRPYTERYADPGDVSIIKCSDCHNSDDRRGPQGPHGSVYQFILARNYSIQDEVDERPRDYDLCYKCHKRSSILGDVSFKYHSLHIRGDIAKGIKGTSCYTCHDAHGSREYTHLIRFNEEVVFKNPSTMEFKFVDKGDFRGECHLMCHGVNHSPKSY